MSMNSTPGRFFVFAAGLAGAAGVALSAVAAHGGGHDTGIAASFLVGEGLYWFLGRTVLAG